MKHHRVFSAAALNMFTEKVFALRKFSKILELALGALSDNRVEQPSFSVKSQS